MGALDSSELWRSTGKSQFESRPVGAFGLSHPVTLTRILFDPSAPGGYVFSSQTPCEIANVIRSYEDDNSELTMRRLEVKCRPPENDIGVDDILICSEHPYSSFWAAAVPFRRGYKGRVKDLPPLQTREQLYDAAQAANVDWWESTGRLTAAVEEPMFHHVFHRRQHDRWHGRSFVLGVLPTDGKGNWRWHLDRVETELSQCPASLKLIAQAEAGRLVVGTRTSYARGDALQEARALAWFSMKQALAGPHENFELWNGRPVIELASRIFRDNMHVLSPSAVSTARRLDMDSPAMLARDLEQARQFLSDWQNIGFEENS